MNMPPEFAEKWVASIVSQSTQIPYPCVAYDAASYTQATPAYKIIKKYLHKYLTLKLFGQLALERNRVPAGANILWLYTGKRNFGDANLELSGRALLKGRKINIDLFTLPNLKELFKEDDIFANVFSSLDEIRRRKYDFILLPEFNHRSIKLKIKLFKNLPYACLFRFFDGPARNQTCFSHAAINSIFSLGLSQDEIYESAKPYLHNTKETANSVSHLIPHEGFLAVSIGGIDPYRSYRFWPEFLRLLDQAPPHEAMPANIVLVGSNNGLEMETLILKNAFQRLRIQSCVGKLSILQTREIISKSRAFVGCDGGLLHVAHSTSTPSISLFSNREPHRMWLTPQCRSLPVQSPGEDSLIPPEDILENLRKLLSAQK